MPPHLRTPIPVAALLLLAACGPGLPPAPHPALHSPPADRDHDRIPDPDDRCPDQPEDPDGADDADGCPDPDNDRDRIPDIEDLCPDQPEDHDAFEDQDGCPEPDDDGDRILDADDLCPREAETYDGREDGDGCPEARLVVVSPPPRDLVRIGFARRSSRLEEGDRTVLDEVAAVMAGNPQIERVLVEGHAASDEGNAERREALSEARARAVVDALLERGVEPGRLVGVGFGSLCPQDPEHPEAETNRRIRFVVMSPPPTTLSPGCAAAADRVPWEAPSPPPPAPPAPAGTP